MHPKSLILILLFLWSCNSSVETTIERRKKCWLPVEIKGIGKVYRYDSQCMISSRVPDFKFKTIGGNFYDNSNSKTKKVYNLWFLACPPCIAEIPELNKLQDDFPDVEFISVCRDEKADLQEFLKNHEFNFIHVENGKKIIDSIFFNVGYPMTIITDKNNTILEINNINNPCKVSKDKVYDWVSFYLR